MNGRRATGSLSIRSDSLCGQQHALQPAEHEASQDVPLAGLATRLSDALRPVRPSAAFVSSLGRELVRDAATRIEVLKRRRRSAAVIAAALGILLTLASLIGAAVYLNSRSRERAEGGATKPAS